MSKVKPLVVYIDKKYILAFRIVMLLIAFPILIDVYEILVSGVADSGKYVSERGEDWGYYAYLFKKSAFAFFFLWLGTFGIKDKLSLNQVEE